MVLRKETNLSDSPVEENTSKSSFARRAGILSFLFFFIKGLAWLAVPTLMAYGFL